ncbi:uncharacterized protein TRIVIDRAFT_81610 [Trichoderma virens Gv29-8]|uniref:Uncharacterized protein n=1 Tax=Hypocrea virens (strain Gv29-8 / FGSC 10586) TaxID=413071 RepID=G9MV14_HYPVG|nr:uncharacterized protein TRIVIDRAFT_81610 [Trichoderma virens Gv29-8]EHK21737.1 hypothetical protein TRIVIDRAFT_81610 [Trichoderma virens Gv29-8]UKZ81590.1 hypothetical protein TrVFT333_009362 [Trichoderma virens FT-333]
MAPSWVIPVACLSAICGVAFVFIWWWFPRMWKRGTQQEMELLARERAERERYMQQRNLEAGITPQEKEAPVASAQEKEAADVLTQGKDSSPTSAQEKQAPAASSPE